jgi:membrane protein implicated in regulation of membrane protease activity
VSKLRKQRCIRALLLSWLIFAYAPGSYCAFTLLKRSVPVLLALLLVTLLVSQASSLFVFPVPDSIRWYGDESWLMPESMALAKTGQLYHPNALASTLETPKTFLLISFPWLRALTYGLPAVWLYPDINPVDVGRALSWIISLMLAGAAAWLVKKSTRDLSIALATALALVASNSFFFASHSARPDAFVGLIVLWGAIAFAQWRQSDPRRWLWLAFVSLLVCIGLPIHLFFYLFAIGLIAFIAQRAWRQPKAWIGVVLGPILAILLVFPLQQALGGRVKSGSSNATEFADVTRDIPLLKPFSLSVQKTALEKHFMLIAEEAPLLLLIAPLLLYLLWRRQNKQSSDRDLVLFAIAGLFIWYFVQRPHPAYLMHIWPLALVAGVLQLQSHRIMRISFVALACVAAVITVLFSGFARSHGSELTHANEQAVHELARIIRSEHRQDPLVMSEAASMKALLTEPGIRLMSTHFQFFPEHPGESIDSTMRRTGVDYVILFNAAMYGYDRNAIDPLVRTVKANSELVTTRVGRFFDIQDDYIDIATAPPLLDTFFLYRVRK